MTQPLVLPRLKPLSPRKSATLCVLDIGCSKVVCLIAKLEPVESSDALRGRTHRARILGIGHQRSRGVKAGVVVNMEEAEASVRLAVDAAERMARVQVESVIVANAGGRLSAACFQANVPIYGAGVTANDLHRVLEATALRTAQPGRSVLHSLPNGFALDGASGIRDPRGMMGEKLGAQFHVVSADSAALRNLMLAIERCHLSVEAVVATPYAAGLSVLVDDEAQLGAIVLDIGGGSVSTGVFQDSKLVHADAFAIGGRHVTMDIARVLNIPLRDAERLKTLHGSAIFSPSDERETLPIVQVAEDRDNPAHIPRAHLNRIIAPRVEEILELARDRLNAAGHPVAGRRVVLTGGASQLTGLPDAARRILGGQIRIGRPLGVQGLPDSAKNPGFAVAVGLLIYPQFSAGEYFEPGRSGAAAPVSKGYFGRMGRWLRESF
ncbi:cell division protein FtsA [Rhodoblastus acidophilus]|uniref:cell division protein FtsA n=1 Tax=Rhodoblastus acidophilus TaxID=1074 RepID=UPI001618E555|nr:cell division protein FtsA [Rhodoblastus acidophilus]MCW2285750.1 cell division protein FtsA [Rhodoblastus acidophilus]MCW2333122.1 cell division protein FtsA [Rhodoblastus acidophilus]